MKKKLSLLYILRNSCCPKCGNYSIFKSFLEIKKKCNCGFKLSNHDIGDGPSFFAIFFLIILIIFFALIVEIKFSPSLWVHLILWTPLVIVFSILLIKYLKIIFLFLNFKYRNK